MTKLNNFFDIIFCINLERSIDRCNKISKKFKDKKIIVSRFEGIDKLNPVIQTQFKEHQKLNVTSKLKRIGRFAIWKTYCKLFDYIIDLGVEKVLIFEDDISFHTDFDNLFDHSSKIIPQNWDMWYLGRTQTKFNDVNIKNNFYKATENTYGAFAIGLKTSFIKSWIDQYKLGKKNNDHFLAVNIPKDNVYVSIPPLIGHELGWSLNSDYEITKSIADKLQWFKYDSQIYL